MKTGKLWVYGFHGNGCLDKHMVLIELGEIENGNTDRSTSEIENKDI